MRDGDLRGMVLERYYDARHKITFLGLTALSTQVAVPPEVLANISEQLDQSGMIEWKPSQSLEGIMDGMGRITAAGVDVIEGTAPPPITITLHDQRISVSGSTSVIVGSGNLQGVNIDVGKLTLGIDQSSASDGEKEEAKSLLDKVVSNKTLWAVIGAILGPAAAQ
jgi:hypothetical protein